MRVINKDCEQAQTAQTQKMGIRNHDKKNRKKQRQKRNCKEVE